VLFKRSRNFGTSEGGREWILTESDTLVNVSGFKIAFGKGTDDKNDRLVRRRERGNEIGQSDEVGRVRGCGDTNCTNRQMRFDRILDDTHENIMRAVGSDNFEIAQQLHHDTSKAFECAWNARVRIHFNEHIAMSVNENLQQTCFAKWRIKQIESMDLELVCHCKIF
jgi:hypothetical protein